MDQSEYDRIVKGGAPKPPTVTGVSPAAPAVPFARPGMTPPTPGLPGVRIGDVGKGMAGGLIGTPGEIESLARTGLRAVGAPVSEKTVLPTSSEVTSALFGKTSEPLARHGREAGELIGGAMSPGGAFKTAKILPRVLPGALKRAASLIDRIATPPESGMNAIGETIRSKLGSALTSFRQARTAATEPARVAYLTQPGEIEESVVRDYRQFLTEELKKPLHPEERAVIQGSLNNVTQGGTVSPGMRVLDVERRNLADLGSGKTEGFGAVKIGKAKDLNTKLESIIEKHVKEFRPYMTEYAEASRPINLFKTAFGKDVVGTAGDYLQDIAKVDPATLPAKAFRSKASINALRELSGGDEEFVQEMGRSYVATRLNQTIGPYLGGRLKDYNAAARAARRWLINEQKTRGITALPEINAEADHFVTNLEKTVRTQERAREIGLGTALGVGATGAYYSIRNLLGTP